MMRRFETMMATATTKIRLACMRASNECSSMPPPFRAASPHPPLNAFTLHPFCDLSAARCRTFLEPYTFSFCTNLSSLCTFLRLPPHPWKGTVEVLKQMSPRYWSYVFEDLDIQSMLPYHCKFERNIVICMRILWLLILFIIY